MTSQTFANREANREPNPEATLEALKACIDKGATSELERVYLSSGLPQVDQWLKGGLLCGHVHEWGMPSGQGGYGFLLLWVRHLTQRKQWCLWVHVAISKKNASVARTQTASVERTQRQACGERGQAQSPLHVFPPAWLAHGVDMKYVCFTRCRSVFDELSAVFFQPFFCLIVLHCPAILKPAELSFLSQRARQQQQAIVILRPWFLSSARGSVWARTRINCLQQQGQYQLQGLKGTQQGSLSFAAVVRETS